jgi:DNA-binding NarL/FixJ family response regulator
MIKVLIADDHIIVCEGIRRILAPCSDMEIVAIANSGSDALDKIRNLEIDVALLDLSMPGICEIDLIKRVKYENPELRIVILSMHSEDQFAVRTLKAGASGYIPKESAPDVLVSAIRKVAAGGKYVSAEVAEKLAFEVDATTIKTLHESLSDREFQVLQRLATGLRPNQIAKELNLSIKTVSTHKQHIMQKLKTPTMASLIAYAIQHRLV